MKQDRVGTTKPRHHRSRYIDTLVTGMIDVCDSSTAPLRGLLWMGKGLFTGISEAHDLATPKTICCAGAQFTVRYRRGSAKGGKKERMDACDVALCFARYICTELEEVKGTRQICPCCLS